MNCLGPHINKQKMTIVGEIQVQSWRLLEIVKTWAPLDAQGKAPPETALLRAQQMYFLAAPLHIYGESVGPSQTLHS